LHDHSEWNRLDAAAYRVSMSRSVRWLARYLAGIGVVVVVCGIAGRFAPLVVMGGVLTCAGLWNLRRPTTTGLIVDGVAVILTGAGQCLAALWIEDARESSVGKWVIAGTIQIVWGIRRLALYRTAHFAPNDREAIARLEAAIRELSKGDPRSDPTIVEFRTGRLRGRRNRLGLYAEGSIGLLEHQAVRLEKRGDIWIESAGTTSLGRTLKVKIQMSDLQLEGRMEPAHLERFERWKLGLSQARPLAA